ncbi:hypothetical protein QYF36_007735 [Acer negundo]|nr:hypothetical protein QYF36_007735 [Acer negundo]
MSLIEKEGPIRILDEKLKVKAVQKLAVSLVGKILTTKFVNREAFMRVIAKIWLVSEGVTIESLTGNIFAFHFTNQEDRGKVLSGVPWTFDNALLVLEKPEGKGMVETLSFNRCGIIGHISIECKSVEKFPVIGGKEQPPFGVWMKAFGAPQKHYSRDPRGLTLLSSQLRGRLSTVGNSGQVAQNITVQADKHIGENAEKVLIEDISMSEPHRSVASNDSKHLDSIDNSSPTINAIKIIDEEKTTSINGSEQAVEAGYCTSTLDNNSGPKMGCIPSFVENEVK